MTMQPDSESLARIIHAALQEDGVDRDITSQQLIPATQNAQAQGVARKGLVGAGVAVISRVFEYMDPALVFHAFTEDGHHAEPGEVLFEVTGPARAILAAERTALNLLQRMCGVATETAYYVQAVKGTKATILDTRKTMPGLRVLDKYAVRCGGGRNHRMGLWDAILIKDNHIALAGGVGVAYERASHQAPKSVPIIIECDSLTQLEEALAFKAKYILLDNMDIATLHNAVTLTAGAAQLEASGNVSRETIRAIAETGVDFISIGRLTHSAPAADIALDIKFT